MSSFHLMSRAKLRLSGVTSSTPRLSLCSIVMCVQGRGEKWIKASTLSNQSSVGVLGHVRASKRPGPQLRPALLWLLEWPNGGLIISVLACCLSL